MRFHHSVVSRNQLSRIASLWPNVLPILRDADPAQERDIANIFHEWIHPNFHGKDACDRYEEESRRIAKQMMAELLVAFTGNWTIHHHLYSYAKKLELLDKVQIDPIAEILYPPRHFSNYEKERVRRQAGVDNYSGSGPLSFMFSTRLAPFKKILLHPDARLQNVGKIGFEYFSKQLELQLAHERRATIRGEFA